MQPYDAERQAEIDAELEEQALARFEMTDEQVEALGLKEYKPGYYFGDPRYPQFGPVDRFLMDHPGPDWKTKSKSPKLEGSVWDEAWKMGDTPEDQARVEQFDHQFDDARIPQPMPTPKSWPILNPGSAENTVGQGRKVPITFGEHRENTARFEQKDRDVVVRFEIQPEDSAVPETPPKLSGLYICRVCTKSFARYPRERALRLTVWGTQLTWVFRSPIACSNCRVFRFKEFQPLGKLDHRPFWNKVFQFWDGETFYVERLQRKMRNAFGKIPGYFVGGPGW